jgi:hypothetical protein
MYRYDVWSTSTLFLREDSTAIIPGNGTHLAFLLASGIFEFFLSEPKNLKLVVLYPSYPTFLRGIIALNGERPK